ncbi:COMM domain-containing protein 3 [Caerostris extrusa]|uniref:COMM domain-containing protein 3 n=1 Tax=Caerostris extrusa TaxID=172846 RepID=A0AAV4TMU6_CAEEX|nr:COMM domain-containing protein 3 [Caerostris extrusa]
MELGKLILDGISSVANIDDQSYNILLNNVFEVTASYKLLKANKCDIKLATDKEAYSSLLSLVVEAAKHNADSASISSTLEECRWDASHISSFVNMFQTHKEKIQTALSMSIIFKNILHYFVHVCVIK